MNQDIATYQRQGFGASLDIQAPVGLLIIDFVNGFADPQAFGGGNIRAAIDRTVGLLKFARDHQWPVAHTHGGRLHHERLRARERRRCDVPRLPSGRRF